MKTKAIIDREKLTVSIYYETEPGKWWLRYQFEVNDIKEETNVELAQKSV